MVLSVVNDIIYVHIQSVYSVSSISYCQNNGNFITLQFLQEIKDSSLVYRSMNIYICISLVTWVWTFKVWSIMYIAQ